MFTPHQGHPNCEGCGDITPVEGLDLSYGRLLCCVCFEAAAFAAKEDCDMSFEDSPPNLVPRSHGSTEPCLPNFPIVETLSFPGGEVVIPEPTRFDMVLSAQQWATRVREELFEFSAELARPARDLHEAQQKRYQVPVPPAVGAALDRLDTILTELLVKL